MSAGTVYASPTARLNVELKGHALHIRLNNPEKFNALSVDMWEGIPYLLRQAEVDANVRLVVLSGEGHKAFASGADISEFKEKRSAAEMVQHYESIAESAVEGIYECSKPTVAFIEGYCIGGGLNVAMSCDLRIASSNAVFSIPAVRMGLGYRASALRNLVGLVGAGHARDIFFTGRRFGADEAYRMGLITRVAEPSAVVAVLDEVVASLSEAAPLTLRAGKRIIHEIMKFDDSFDDALSRQLIMDCFNSEDYKEGRQAFMEKRKPRFKGV